MVADSDPHILISNDRLLSTRLLGNRTFLHSDKKVYNNLKRIVHDDSQRLDEGSSNIHMSQVNVVRL